MIDIKHVTKIYPIYDNKQKKNRLAKIISNKTGDKMALNSISLQIDKGEFVGLLGPNGAGKSSLIKILSGVMATTSGEVNVCNLNPIKQRKQHARNIGVLFGQKTQLWWDLPLIHSLTLLGHIYQIPMRKLSNRIEELIELVDLSSFINRPVRQLSLGERMRGEIAATLIHEPPVLFLDEPTIGLDVVSKYNIQNLLENINQTMNTTIILTTHNVDDIEKLCKRVVFINHGNIIFDNTIEKLKEVATRKKYIVIETVDPLTNQCSFYWEKVEDTNYWIPFLEDNEAYEILRQLQLLSIKLKKFTIKEPQLDEIIRDLYTEQTEEGKL